MKVKHGRSEHELDREMTVRRLLETLDIVPEWVRPEGSPAPRAPLVMA